MSDHDWQIISVGLAFAAALLNLILIPLVKSAARGEVEDLIKEHNESDLSHPRLDGIAKLEEDVRQFKRDMSSKLDELTEAITQLREGLARRSASPKKRSR